MSAQPTKKRREKAIIDYVPFELSEKARAKLPEGAKVKYMLRKEERATGTAMRAEARYWSPERGCDVFLQSKSMGVIPPGETEPRPPRGKNWRGKKKQNETPAEQPESSALTDIMTGHDPIKLEEELQEKLNAVEAAEPREKLSCEKLMQSFPMPVVDTRTPMRCQYAVADVLMVGFMAALRGDCGPTAVADYWSNHYDELAQLFENWGNSREISDETVRRIYGLIDGEAVIKLVAHNFASGPKTLPTNHRLLSMDGQAIRASRNTEDRPHMVLSVYDPLNKQTLSHVRIEDKSNEIPKGNEIISSLDLAGTVVIADALHTQTDLAQAITDRYGHYILALKGNQKLLHEYVGFAFGSPMGDKPKPAERETKDLAHGRIETRTAWALPASCLSDEILNGWAGLSRGSIVAVRSECVCKKTAEVREDIRYFITTLDYRQPYVLETIVEAIRAHWGIENTLHWKLDVLMSQDRFAANDMHVVMAQATIAKHALHLLHAIQAREAQKGKTLSTTQIQRALVTPERVINKLKELGLL